MQRCPTKSPQVYFCLATLFRMPAEHFFKYIYKKYTHNCRFYFDLYFKICLLRLFLTNICPLRQFVLDSNPIVKKVGHCWPKVCLLTKQFFKLLTFYPKAYNLIKLSLCYTSSQKNEQFLVTVKNKK